MRIFAIILLIIFSLYTLILIPGAIKKDKSSLISGLIVTAPVIVFIILYLCNVGG